MKRKVLSVILTGAMVAGLAGTVTVHAEEQKTYNIGICQLVQHEALDAATQGFEDAVKEGLGEENVTFDEQNAQGDSATCSTIINNFVSSNVDLILANATASLQEMCIRDRDSIGSCLSTARRTNGAVAIFLPGVAKRLADLMDADFYMVFTSIHEDVYKRQYWIIQIIPEILLIRGIRGILNLLIEM